MSILIAYCKYLSILAGRFEDAKNLASSAFNESSLHTNSFEEEGSLKILQKIRDEFMTIDDRQLKSVAVQNPKELKQSRSNVIISAAANHGNESLPPSQQSKFVNICRVRAPSPSPIVSGNHKL